MAEFANIRTGTILTTLVGESTRALANAAAENARVLTELGLELAQQRRIIATAATEQRRIIAAAATEQGCINAAAVAEQGRINAAAIAEQGRTNAAVLSERGRVLVDLGRQLTAAFETHAPASALCFKSPEDKVGGGTCHMFVQERVAYFPTTAILVLIIALLSFVVALQEY